MNLILILILLVWRIHADTSLQLSTGIYSFVEEPYMSWVKANQHCKGEGGKLVEIDSEEENTALVEEINRRGFTDRHMHFWIGLTDRRIEGDWRLESAGSEPSYLNWHRGQPSHNYATRGNQDCARLRIGPKPSWKDTWSDVGCNTVRVQNPNYPYFTLHALCEFDPSKVSPSTESPLTETSPLYGTTTESNTTEANTTEYATEGTTNAGDSIIIKMTK